MERLKCEGRLVGSCRGTPRKVQTLVLTDSCYYATLQVEIVTFDTSQDDWPYTVQYDLRLFFHSSRTALMYATLGRQRALRYRYRRAAETDPLGPAQQLGKTGWLCKPRSRRDAGPGYEYMAPGADELTVHLPVTGYMLRTEIVSPYSTKFTLTDTGKRTCKKKQGWIPYRRVGWGSKAERLSLPDTESVVFLNTCKKKQGWMPYRRVGWGSKAERLSIPGAALTYHPRRPSFLRVKRQQQGTPDETTTKKEESFETELCKDKDAGEWFRLVAGEGDNCRDVIQCTSSDNDEDEWFRLVMETTAEMSSSVLFRFQLVAEEGDNCRDVIQCTSSVSTNYVRIRMRTIGSDCTNYVRIRMQESSSDLWLVRETTAEISFIIPLRLYQARRDERESVVWVQQFVKRESMKYASCCVYMAGVMT
ncbi:hypothetical protein J6590_058293 [Homalodisca vitripennis]|nr:hypothetical protein J6590_058293 [Homalodisca vitripennis]